MRPFSGRGVYICANTIRIRVASTAVVICLLSTSAAVQEGDSVVDHLRSATSESSSSVSGGRELSGLPQDFFSRPPDSGLSGLSVPYCLPGAGASSKLVFSSVWTHPGSARENRGESPSKPDCCAAGKAEDFLL